MSHSTATPLGTGLEELWKESNEGNGETRWVKLQLVADAFKVIESQGKRGEEDALEFNELQQHVQDREAAFFLFKLAPRKWLLVSYVPDLAPVKDKMSYASAKGTLKSKLGFSFFEDDFHVTNKRDLTWEHYKDSKKEVDSRSFHEIAKEEVVKLENKEREERTKEDQNPLAVLVSLGDSAKDAMAKLKSNGANFVEFAIENQVVNGVQTKSVDITELPKHIDAVNPRFYLFVNQRGLPTATSPATSRVVFIYCCPDKSPTKLRMVYSTAKGTVADLVEKQGITLVKKRLEIREGSELTSEFISSESNARVDIKSPKVAAVSPKGTPVGGGQVKAANAPTFNAPHPVYNLMKPKEEGTGAKKKIVMPPPAAYQ